IVEAVRLPRLVKKEMRVLNREEQDRLVTAARLMPEPAAFGIIFDLFTGIRLGELCGLRWENVHMELKQFLVCETRNRLPNFDDAIKTSTSVKTEMNTKTVNYRRVVYLMENLYQDFGQYKSIQDSMASQYPGYNPDGYVFCQDCGRPYEPRTYQDLFKRCVRQAGIKDANFHSLRHTFATRSLEQGMDIVTLSRLLGHASPSITMDKYGHSLDEQKRASVEKLGNLYNSASARYSRPAK
ncbi:MAG: site-specific integrase, partial [Abditibacteriota bacterium]|nr:site-specific integrase [Abditibacteriota bacterium]